MAKEVYPDEPSFSRATSAPGGYGIHWPLLDEDLSVSGLLRSA